MFLSDNIPTILCSPRVALMKCKANAPEFKGKLHLFRNDNDYSTPVIDLENRALDYTMQFSYPYYYVAPKILVSYDSFKHLAQGLAGANRLAQFRIVVDEAQAMFGDASFKGDTELEFLSILQHCDNIIYLSAKPYIEDYLDEIDVFKNLPYVKLEWPESSIHSTNIEQLRYYGGSPLQTAKRIIQEYRNNGYFKEKIVDGRLLRSYEAVFFVNNVQLILRMIQDNGLKPEEVNIICSRANDNKNEERLRKQGFTIGDIPQKGEPHKTFSFVTKSSFEGVDFYSESAYTYIFSDIKQDTMAIDISLDLPQILGRQRLESNPFRYDASFFYRTKPDFSDEENARFRQRIMEKVELTNECIAMYNEANPKRKNIIVRGYRSNQTLDRYSKDYTTVIDDSVSGSVTVELNYLAMFNEIRAWEIQKKQYTNGCQVLASIEDSTFTMDSSITSALPGMCNGSFEERMKAYCNFLSVHPEYKADLEGLPQIQTAIKQYYNNLGPSTLRSLSFKESDIKQYLESINVQGEVEKRVSESFLSGSFYTNEQVKSMLAKIYEDAGYGRTAKATDLKELIECQPRKETYDGVRMNGYLIL